MAGTALSNFNDFVLNTGPAFLTGPEQVINEAVAQTYVLGRLLKGRGLDKVIQGGREIRDIVMFDESSTYDHYLPNQTFTWSNPQVTTELSIDWRFSIDHMAWTDQEIELNVPDGLSTDAQKVVYKKLKRIKEQRMWTSMLKGIEADIWKSAHGRSTDMESATGSLPFSIPAFLTEAQGTDAANNFLPGRATGDAGSGQWTTLMGVNPSTESGWRNQVSSYSFADPDDTGGNNTGLFDAFARMYRKVDFKPPGSKDEYFENADMKRFMICCSLKGIVLFEKMCRESQDRFAAAGGQDPAFLRPNYGGIELLYIAALDTAALYWEEGATQYVAEDSSLLGGTTGAEAAQPYAADWADGPRYYWINGNYLTPVFHSRRYFYKKDIMPHPNQPYTTVVPVDCWWNMFCNSRKRQGVVYPNA
jgi:hypothetical protein